MFFLGLSCLEASRIPHKSAFLTSEGSAWDVSSPVQLSSAFRHHTVQFAYSLSHCAAVTDTALLHTPPTVALGCELLKNAPCWKLRVLLECAGEATEPATGGTQEYHVEEPDQSASEAEEPAPPPSKGRGRPKKTNTNPGQVCCTDQ